jgi:SnoaL-like domain
MSEPGQLAELAEDDTDRPDDVPARLARIEQDLAHTRAQLDTLAAAEAVRQCLYRLNRGIDRLDRDLLAAAFHPDAQVHYGRIYDGPAAGFVETTLTFQRSQRESQHLLGNIAVTVEGDTAVAESYEVSRHVHDEDGTPVELVIGARCLDRLAHRDGTWAITDRVKVIDWGRRHERPGDWLATAPLATGTRDRSDPSYRLMPSRDGRPGTRSEGADRG